MLDQTTTMMLECSACGAKANAECACGVEYVPAGTRAAAAIAKNPEKSDRAIAAEIGVSDRTINRARKTTATDVAVGTKRTGKDGRTRQVPQTKNSRRQMDMPKTDAVREAIRATVVAGKTIDRQAWAKKLSVSVATVQRAESAERGRLEGLRDGDSICISIHILIEKLVPLFERVREQSKRHVGLICQPELLLIASEGRKLLDLWASNDTSVHRVNGHVAPRKRPVNSEKGVS